MKKGGGSQGTKIRTRNVETKHETTYYSLPMGADLEDRSGKDAEDILQPTSSSVVGSQNDYAI
ncbi:unnamed protein product [Ectocarpus sp. CCAP 1310/34]|nr:unnamed protein product [Ectocarpus sp. CCAP 1310/34]